MAKKTKPIINGTCRDCKHAYNWHSPAVDGHMTLAQCEYVTNRCVISSERACINFLKNEI